jgi:hypothetical protein
MSCMLIYTNKRNISIRKRVLFRLLYFEMSYWTDSRTFAMMTVLTQWSSDYTRIFVSHFTVFKQAVVVKIRKYSTARQETQLQFT